ncbi:MAG: hypothetical protein WDO15_18155 [Bacteroidota bacterium]
MKRIIMFALIAWSRRCSAQGFSGQTNDIYLNFKSASNATLPVIGWVYPRLENTATPNNKIEIEAEVHSEAPLRQISVTIERTRVAQLKKNFPSRPDSCRTKSSSH